MACKNQFTPDVQQAAPALAPSPLTPAETGLAARGVCLSTPPSAHAALRTLDRERPVSSTMTAALPALPWHAQQETWSQARHFKIAEHAAV